jgi:hypothetical protein
MKFGPRASVSPKTRPRVQNMKIRPDALGTAENGYGTAKTRKLDPTTSVPPKKSPESQDMKIDLAPSVPPKMSLGA